MNKSIVIGAVLVPGERAPFLVTEEMVKKMKPGSVIIDISIDQGGCVATSRPTTLDRPTYVQHGVVHYCVPNMTSNVPRTGSRVLSNVALPYIKALAERGLEGALLHDPALAMGTYIYKGLLVHRALGEHFGIPTEPLADLLAREA